MRRRKKDKTQEKSVSLPSTDDVLDLSGRGRSSKSAKNGGTDGSTGSALLLARGSNKGGSPPQQRKRSLLGLGSMRDLVEQVLHGTMDAVLLKNGRVKVAGVRCSEHVRVALSLSCVCRIL